MFLRGRRDIGKRFTSKALTLRTISRPELWQLNFISPWAVLLHWVPDVLVAFAGFNEFRTHSRPCICVACTCRCHPRHCRSFGKLEACTGRRSRGLGVGVMFVLALVVVGRCSVARGSLHVLRAHLTWQLQQVLVSLGMSTGKTCPEPVAVTGRELDGQQLPGESSESLVHGMTVICVVMDTGT